MPALDKIIQAMANRQATAIVFQADQPPMFQTPQGPIQALKSPMPAAHVTGYLRELAPPAQVGLLDQGQDCQFEYQGHQVMVSFQGGTVRAHIHAPGAAAPAAAGPAPAPAPAAPAAAPAAAAPAAAPAAPAARGDRTGNGNKIDPLFFEMIERGASDLHLTTNEPPMLRLDGEMVKLDQFPVINPEAMEEYLWPICPDKNRKEFEEIKDTDFAYEIPGLARFRCNFFMDRFGMGAVYRQIPTDILTVEKLGLSDKILDLCWLSKGFVVVTGPTGSGKSTTLAALVDYINRHRNDHIITIEDPIEFVHPNKNCLINQREVGVHTSGFKRALRAALREDPDIVLVGEMRDLETIAIAIETAETGHLVFGTLHTTTAASTIDRIIDQFPADRQSQVRMMLSESLKGVIAQTLCKKIGGGRVAALEVLLVNNSISNLIREGKTFQIPSIMQTQKGIGNVTLNDSLLTLVKDGLVEPEEAYIKAVDKDAFKGMLGRNNITLDMEKAK